MKYGHLLMVCKQMCLHNRTDQALMLKNRASISGRLMTNSLTLPLEDFKSRYLTQAFWTP